ncbi:hypothetical protein [Halobacillus sp. H74]|uniref:hypothetical protein n=1 Tax=Halobacillus sp. H74 TaxID=3457436 RepID=UPI003FCCDEF7
MANPKGFAAVDSEAAIVKVEVKKCRDWLGFSYADDGWHYFCATIKQYIDEPSLSYKKSILRKYYQLFQPKSLREGLFYKVADTPLKKHNLWMPLPWENNLKLPEGDHQHFGPNSEAYGETELLRTLRVYKKIRKAGYQPRHFPDGYIRGYFLKSGKDYRFKLTAGQHRMAALGVMGHQTVKVKVQSKWERVIDPAKIKEWPQVRNRRYTKEQALYIFNSYFKQTGRERAIRLGLMK